LRLTPTPSPHKNRHIHLFSLTSRLAVNHFDKIIFRRFEIVSIQREKNDAGCDAVAWERRAPARQMKPKASHLDRRHEAKPKNGDNIKNQGISKSQAGAWRSQAKIPSFMP
jgi:hypothetical protein